MTTDRDRCPFCDSRDLTVKKLKHVEVLVCAYCSRIIEEKDIEKPRPKESKIEA